MPIKSSNSIGTQKHMIAFKINKSINCVLRLHAHQFYLDSIKITLGPLPLYTSLRTANHAHSAHSSDGWCGRNCTREIHHQWDIDTQSNENSCSIYFFPVNSTTTKIACQIEFEFRALISQRGRMYAIERGNLLQKGMLSRIQVKPIPRDFSMDMWVDSHFVSLSSIFKRCRKF